MSYLDRTYTVNLSEMWQKAFPERMKAFIDAVAANVQVAPDMVALPLLATLCVPLQSRFQIRVDSNYTEPLCLYTMTVARPSERKSAVMNILTKPLWEYQMRVNERLEAMEQPLITLYVTDATPEKLTYIMKENKGAVALLSDEPDALAVAAGLRYGKGKNLGLMLQAWSAGHVLVQRATAEQKRVSIDRAVMSVAVMSQPSFVQDLMSDKEILSRGFPQRFLYGLPLSKVGSRSFFKPEIPEEVLTWYYKLMEDWLETPNDAVQDLTLDSVARDVANEMFNWVEEQIPKNPEIEGWLGKLFGQLLRVAGVFHCVQWGTEAAAHEISGDSVAAAMTLAEYFTSHAKAVFTDFNPTEAAKDARELYRRMKKDGRTSFFRTDLLRLVGCHWKKDRMNAALMELKNAQYIDLFSGADDIGTKSEHWVLLGDITPPDETELS